MQSVELICHPTTPCEVIHRFEVRVSRAGGKLSLRYSIEGNIARLCIPLPSSSRRADGLWRHTCFEAFLNGSGSAGYCEFNFAPSTEWAIYRFEVYREGMAAVENVEPPKIALYRDAHRLELDALIDLNHLPPLPEVAELRLGLCAVIEEEGGRLTYWALVHPQEKPDFHHPDSFALLLDRDGKA